MRIDTDAHVDECEATWAYIPEEASRYRPVTIETGSRMWMWPGRTRPRHRRSDDKTHTTESTRTLADVDLRLRHMDERGIDVQVIYPTFFLSASSDKSDVELALCRSYNRWLADATEKSNGRLRWVVVPPYLSVGAALAEIEWAKAHGACGVLKRGTEMNRPASDPYFSPFYEAAADLDMPVCMHAGSGDPTGVSPVNPRLHAISACLDMVGAGTPERFPELRVGWIECSASWIPYVWQDIVARQNANSWGSTIRDIPGRESIDIDTNMFARFGFYSSVETTDDLDYLLKFGLEDSLFLGSDYGHSDASAVFDVHQIVEDRVTAGTLSEGVAAKLTHLNAQRFYAI